jgi:uncharacterized protein (TIGR02246 family)
MRKMSWIAAIVLAGLSVVSVGAQKPDPDAQKIIDQYTAAFNKGDAKGVAALYTADATRVGPDGQLLTGRAAVEKSYADGFAGAIKGSTLSIQQGRVQVVTPDVKIMEGRFATTGAAGVKGRYVNTAVRQGGAWLLASVVTILDPPPPPAK